MIKSSYKISLLFILLLPFAILKAQEDNAEFISQFMPAEMDTGKSYDVWINMKNTGTTTWKAYSPDDPESYVLGFVKNESIKEENIFTDFSGVGLNIDVAPGTEAGFYFKIESPSKAGHYISQWRMMKGKNFFGDESKSVIVNVLRERIDTTLVNNASFVKSTVPKLMKCGYRSAVSFVVENTGTTKWIPGKHFLTFVDKNNEPTGDNAWGISTVKLSSAVEPGGKITFKIQVKVPQETGIYNMQFAMSDGNKIFGDPSSLVKVSAQK